MSRERVRQIEVRAFEKMQEAVKNRVAAIETPVHYRQPDDVSLERKIASHQIVVDSLRTVQPQKTSYNGSNG